MGLPLPAPLNKRTTERLLDIQQVGARVCVWVCGWVGWSGVGGGMRVCVVRWVGGAVHGRHTLRKRPADSPEE